MGYSLLPAARDCAGVGMIGENAAKKVQVIIVDTVRRLMTVALELRRVLHRHRSPPIKFRDYRFGVRFRYARAVVNGVGLRHVSNPVECLVNRFKGAPPP